jgi:transcriptional regulator with XRE-family HTH domain
MGIGKQLANRVRELGLSQAEAARKCGLSEKRFNNYVNDGREPDFETLLHICDQLQITPNRLFSYLSSADDISGDERQLLTVYRGLSVDNRSAVRSVADSLGRGGTDHEHRPQHTRRIVRR